MAVAPGWYDDPDRVPGRQRWWDGAGWGDLTRGGPPAPAPWASDAAPTSSAADVLSGRPERGSHLPVWIAVALAAVVVLVVTSVVLLRDGTTVARPGPPTAGSTATAPPTGAFPPGTVRIIDPDAGISYAYLGEGWHEVDFDQRPEMQAVRGQFITTQELTPDGGTFIAEATSGLLAASFGTPAPAGYPRLAPGLADSFRANYYPGPNERSVVRRESVEVAGVAAYVYEFDLRWDIAGYDSTGERAALVIMDTGKPAPAILFVSIPNTHAELYGVIDRLIASVELL